MTRRDRDPAPPPLEASDRTVTLTLTAGWMVALVVLLAVHGQLAPGQRWWIWTCATGTGMGLFALWFVPRLKQARERGGRPGGSARVE